MANRYRVVRVSPSRQVIADFAVANNASLATEQAQRAAAFARARSERSSNPGWRIRIFSPSSLGDEQSPDCVWDSELNQ